MTTTLSPRREVAREATRPSNVRRAHPRTVGLADRIALRIGILLIVWSRRPRAVREGRPDAVSIQAALAAHRRAQDDYWKHVPLR